jgi:hypothetical protein
MYLHCGIAVTSCTAAAHLSSCQSLRKPESLGKPESLEEYTMGPCTILCRHALGTHACTCVLYTLMHCMSLVYLIYWAGSLSALTPASVLLLFAPGE